MINTKLALNIKRMGAIPENQEQWADEAILDIATDEMNERMLPFLFMINQGAFDHVFRVPIVANVQTYQLSSRASFGSVRDIRLIVGEKKVNLLPIDPTLAVSTAPGSPSGYHFQKSRIVLDCPPAQDGTLEYTARIRPSRLTEISYSARVTAFDPALRTVTVDAIPSDFQVGTKLDFVMGESAHDLLAIDNAITLIDVPTLTLTLSADLPESLAIGDWVSPAGTSPVAQISEELHSTLSLMAASRYLFTIGQLDQKQAVDDRVKENLLAFKSIMYPRGRGENEIAVSPYFNF